MIVVDVETSGINPQKHSIASIGAIYFFEPEKQFYEECRIWDGAEIEEEALKVNGFTRKQITDASKQPLEEAVRKFLIWADKSRIKTLAGNNTSFDRDFLINSAERYNIGHNIHRRTVDLHSVCVANLLERGLELPVKDGVIDLGTNKILIYAGLLSEPEPHNALVGAKMEAEAFSRIFYGRPLLDEFKGFRVPDYLRR